MPPYPVDNQNGVCQATCGWHSSRSHWIGSNRSTECALTPMLPNEWPLTGRLCGQSRQTGNETVIRSPAQGNRLRPWCCVDELRMPGHCSGKCYGRPEKGAKIKIGCRCWRNEAVVGRPSGGLVFLSAIGGLRKLTLRKVKGPRAFAASRLNAELGSDS